MLLLPWGGDEDDDDENDNDDDDDDDGGSGGGGGGGGSGDNKCPNNLLSHDPRQAHSKLGVVESACYNTGEGEYNILNISNRMPLSMS